MANKYGNKGAPLERRKEICEFYENHSQSATLKHFGIGAASLFNYRKQLGYPNKQPCKAKYKDTFKHEVCQYYEHHTGEETIAKYSITIASLCKWRADLGYRNKHRGFNLYTESMQPTVAKRVRRNFQMTRSENGELKAELMEIKLQYAVLEREFQQLRNRIMEAVQ
jgi:hypothetical protein